MVGEIVKLFTVLGLGILELWLAIPAGFALHLHPLMTAFVSGLGAIIGAMIIIVIGEGVRSWLLRGSTSVDHKEKAIYKIWDKYGVIGLGMLSPLLTGALLGAAIGIALGALPKKLLLWMALGIIVWTIILTVLAYYGFGSPSA